MKTNKVSPEAVQWLKRISFKSKNPFHYEAYNFLKDVHKLNVLPKFYGSGKYAYEIHQFNDDATGWTKVSGFLTKSFYSFEEAFDGAIIEAVKIKLKGEEEDVEVPNTGNVTNKGLKNNMDFKFNLGDNQFKIS